MSWLRGHSGHRCRSVVPGRSPSCSISGRRRSITVPDSPVEIAPVYVTLASQESSYVTGQVWGITGGDGVPG